MSKIKILEIVPSLSQTNGVASYISSYVKYMDRSKFDFTFLVLNNKDHGRYDEIEKCGGKIIELFIEKNFINYINKIKKMYKKNNFDIVHCHVPNYGVLYLYYAKKYGIKYRILHSHNNKNSDKILNGIRNSILNRFSVLLANNYVACSKDAGRFLFKNRNFTIINNAVDVKKYKFNEQKRIELRKKFGVENKILIGEFGRFCPQKNQLFTIDIIREIIKYNTDYILVLAGSGPMQDIIYEKVKKYNLENHVLFLGSRNDLNEIYNMLDYFVLPSKYEGLGIVLIEAQSNGLHCFTSKGKVPKEARVTNLLQFVELKNNPNQWANLITNTDCKRGNEINSIIKNGYDINTNAEYLKKYYFDLIKKKEIF